ncbi:MAG: hypothetical protein AB8B64_18550 [Granulosicoccus sp.]
MAWVIVQRLDRRISRLRALTLSVSDREQSGINHMKAIHDAIVSKDSTAVRLAVEADIDDASTIAVRLLSNEAEREVAGG